MKKFLSICAAFIFVGSIAYGQKGKEIVLGLGGALTSTSIINQNFYGEPEIDFAPKMGYGVQFTAGYYFNEYIAVVAEIQYSAQGQKYEGKQAFTDPNTGIAYNFTKVERDIKLSYLNIPLFFKYTFGTHKAKFRFLVGPQLGYLLEATQDYIRDGKKIGTEITNLDGKDFVTDAGDITERFESIDFSFALDVGTDIYFTKQLFLTAGFRGNYGFMDINATAYRLNDISGEYSPSHNLWGGLYIGINYLIDVQGYSQRSF
ncbi:MAG: PorT family protein [Bacteroidales bacterium]|nr:PorT family protein [Bacteroidales bacterium]